MGLFGDLIQEFFQEAIEEVLEEVLEELYDETCAVADLYLNDSDAANEGAAAIMNDCIAPACLDVIDAWGDAWPEGAHPADFADAGLGSHGAAEDTWGGTLDTAAADMSSIIDEAHAVWVVLQVVGDGEEEDYDEEEGEEE